ncbi:SHOCT domain-containing protein [bacterium]|nr:SHOCT domain-containing protein [bacterium]
MFIEYLSLFMMFMLLCAFICALICIPVFIANARGICGGQKTAIMILSWLGIFFGVTWIVALILSLVWHGDGECTKCGCGSRLDELEKLAKLYKAKVITKSEYDKMKAKLLKDK